MWSLLHFALIGFFLLQLVVVGGWLILEGSRRFATRRRSKAASPLPRDLLVYLIPLSVVLYTFLVSTLAHHGEARFRNPVDPLIVFILFVGARIWWRLATEQPVSTSSVAPR